MVGVQNTLRVVNEVGEIAVSGIAIVKKGIGLGSLRQLFSMLEDVKDLVAAAPLALPELADVDQAEAGLLAQGVYGVVRKIVVAIAA